MAKEKVKINFGNMLSDARSAYEDDEVLDYFGLSSDVVEEIEISRISPNPYQPRKHFDEEALKELSESIKRHGLIQPIIVIRKEDGYMLIAGERRYRATKLLGENKIKAIVADLESKNLREIALIENIQRENLNPIELANSYQELINEYKITQEALSNIIHKSRTQITNTLRLLTLSKQTQQFLIDDKLTQGHAKIVVGLEPNDEKMVVDTIIGQKLNVRDTENLVRKIKEKKTPKEEILQEDKEYKDALLKLQKNIQNLNFTSKIKNKNLIIEFKNISEINDFIDKIR
ncbi:ParB/RepB/Spo0J family partition protein [Campylobacter mucosalis]|uniref:Chromosome partitioning protein n=1 Tax=Campylobacter mucosalis CCUG 21559 TaxID=1032067 RepID=A0A6G5QF29_9BACT|nr:ParB/RepB/Spo0J family partition protein [Campylobacter mucosalis]KEA46051.1 chromosome partitioning protein ParB [Campylobacter mucosalis]QCD44278.1 chromosome partitioning protein [Campylobacter mucosalis CCUG 21559]QKF63527.1 chromosome partitioning protein [Campylobacter mucosalis]